MDNKVGDKIFTVNETPEPIPDTMEILSDITCEFVSTNQAIITNEIKTCKEPAEFSINDIKPSTVYWVNGIRSRRRPVRYDLLFRHMNTYNKQNNSNVSAPSKSEKLNPETKTLTQPVTLLSDHLKEKRKICKTMDSLVQTDTLRTVPRGKIFKENDFASNKRYNQQNKLNVQNSKRKKRYLENSSNTPIVNQNNKPIGTERLDEHAREKDIYRYQLNLQHIKKLKNEKLKRLQMNRYFSKWKKYRCESPLNSDFTATRPTMIKTDSEQCSDFFESKCKKEAFCQNQKKGLKIHKKKELNSSFERLLTTVKEEKQNTLENVHQTHSDFKIQKNLRKLKKNCNSSFEKFLKQMKQKQLTDMKQKRQLQNHRSINANNHVGIKNNQRGPISTTETLVDKRHGSSDHSISKSSKRKRTYHSKINKNNNVKGSKKIVITNTYKNGKTLDECSDTKPKRINPLPSNPTSLVESDIRVNIDCSNKKELTTSTRVDCKTTQTTTDVSLSIMCKVDSHTSSIDLAIKHLNEANTENVINHSSVSCNIPNLNNVTSNKEDNCLEKKLEPFDSKLNIEKKSSKNITPEHDMNLVILDVITEEEQKVIELKNEIDLSAMETSSYDQLVQFIDEDLDFFEEANRSIKSSSSFINRKSSSNGSRIKSRGSYALEKIS